MALGFCLSWLRLPSSSCPPNFRSLKLSLAHLEAFATKGAQQKQPPPTPIAATFAGPSIFRTWCELKRAGQWAWTARRYQLIQVSLFYSWRNRERRWLVWGTSATLPPNQESLVGTCLPTLCGSEALGPREGSARVRDPLLPLCLSLKCLEMVM